MPKIPVRSATLVDAIYGHYVEAADKKDRTYLGMSTFGTECDRALWYAFRWARAPESFDGRMLRLFQTGHREEARMLDDLEAVGLIVQRTDPKTGEQWAFRDKKGHLRGHADGMAMGTMPDCHHEHHLLEFKTHNEVSFKKLVSDGVKKTKFGHYCQMQLYMHYSGRRCALYMAHNKNTDELYTEHVAYDAGFAETTVRRGQRIIDSPNPPSRLHEDPTAKAAFTCRFCPALKVCHERAFSPRNCRTCLQSTPVTGGFHCNKHDTMLTADEQRLGCSDHLYIPALVPGRQITADIVKHTVTYHMPDGTTFIDGEKT